MNSCSDWVRAALAFFYPEVCQVCGTHRAAPADGFVCLECRSQARLITAPFCSRCGLPFEGDLTTPFECANCRDLEFEFESARSAAAARGPVLEAIHRYKYHRALWFEPFLASLLTRQAVPELARGRWDAIVPVPLHSVKQRQREFNQAERLARCLSRASGIPLETGLLRRVQPTDTQTLLTRQERAANVRHAFALSTNRGLRGRRFVLVDDVFTTGSTTNACAAVLRRSGADAVCVWTVARGL